MREGLFNELSAVGSLSTSEHNGSMAGIMLLELSRATRLGSPVVDITRFLETSDETRDGGAMEVEPTRNLMIRLTEVLELDYLSDLAWGGVDHSIKSDSELN
jgi:hypothetical protein